MEPDAVFAQVAEHRRAAADAFDALSDEQWAAPSLCEGWSVRVLAAHMALPMTMGRAPFVLEILKARGDLDRTMDVASRRAARRPVAETVRVLRDRAEHRFKPPGAPVETPLVEVMLHTRDAARPLGLELGPTVEQWQTVLTFLSSRGSHRIFGTKSRLDGLRLASTDSDFSAGAGPTVSGPSEALALAMAGRSAALADLTGEGVAVLRGRLAP